ncbi:MAG TPA: AAA family ATPase, partial [Chloroflexota bacterium]|nr:AAA family ATPase [Chloroflexota bacterium]
MFSPTPPPLPSWPVPALVGRDHEEAALRVAQAAAIAGRGSLVLIGGEAGIGKTALAEALCHEAGKQGAVILVGRCHDLAETPPYGPWATLLLAAPSGPDLPEPPELGGTANPNSRAALFAQVRDYLAALVTHRPVVLLLEDLHWADPASLDLLRSLASSLDTLPLLLLATYRPEDLTRDHPLAALLPALVRESRPVRLDLRPLSDEAVGTLVDARYSLPTSDAMRLVDWLQARAEGNPFYALELLQGIEEEGLLQCVGDRWILGDLARASLPPLLRQVIDRRIARLGMEARRALAVAAVIGQEVPVSRWAEVSHAEEDTLLAVVEAAEAAHLLAVTGDGSTVRFAHALIREALYAG